MNWLSSGAHRNIQEWAEPYLVFELPLPTDFGVLFLFGIVSLAIASQVGCQRS